MRKNSLSIFSYQHLIKNIETILKSGLVSAQKALERERLKTYWMIGKSIREHVEASGGEVELCPALYTRISRDVKKALGLEILPDTVCRAIRFNTSYPKFPSRTTLSFTHYMVLLRVQDQGLRLSLERKAISQKMSVGDLRSEVTLFSAQERAQDGKALRSLGAERGEPYVYYLRSCEDIEGQGARAVDLGFHVQLPLDGGVVRARPLGATKSGQVVRVVKRDGRYELKKSNRVYKKCYTYFARVTKVVDGDTLDVRIDLGFGIWLNERLRLNGIDTPEIDTPQGKRAKIFVEKMFSGAPYVVVRTHKTGKYGRWLADVYLSPLGQGGGDPYVIAREGPLLNQLLLDQGLARVI